MCCVPLCQRAAPGWWSPLALPAPPSEEPDGSVEWAIDTTGRHEYWPTATPHLLTGKAYSHTDIPRAVRFDNTHMCLHASADLFCIIRINRTSFPTKTCAMQKHFFFCIIDFVNSMECYKYVNIRPPYTYAFLIRCVSNQFTQMTYSIIFFLLYVYTHIYYITICIHVFIASLYTYIYIYLYLCPFFSIVNIGGTR